MMKKITLIIIACLFGVFYSSNAQTVFWVEAFNNSCTQACPDSTYTGSNGAWTTMVTGAQGTYSNIWYVSCAENGNAIGACGTGCGSDATLHIANVPNSPSALLCPTGDCGASYDAGLGTGEVVTSTRAVSPIINCAGKYNITLDFKYIAKGQLQHDYCTIDYYDGTTWATLQTITPTINTGCAGQGRWTAHPSYTLPASANNNANVNIGFNWINDDDGVGTDPSIALDSVRLSYSSLTGIDYLNSNGNSISVYPTPNNGNFTFSYHLSTPNAEFHILDLTGRIVYSQNVNGTEGNQIIDASFLNNGIYYWEVISVNAVPSKGRIAIVK